MKKVATELEKTEMGYIARTVDEEQHLFASGKTPEEVVARLAKRAAAAYQTEVDLHQVSYLDRSTNETEHEGFDTIF
jgi:hypothetical protein